MCSIKTLAQMVSNARNASGTSKPCRKRLPNWASHLSHLPQFRQRLELNQPTGRIWPISRQQECQTLEEFIRNGYTLVAVRVGAGIFMTTGVEVGVPSGDSFVSMELRGVFVDVNSED